MTTAHQKLTVTCEEQPGNAEPSLAVRAEALRIFYAASFKAHTVNERQIAQAWW